MSEIAIVLSRRGRISGKSPSAAAITVAELVRHSRYRDQTRVMLHAVQEAPTGVRLEQVEVDYKWYRTRSQSYSASVIKALKQSPPAFIDVHNRPVLFRAIASQFPESIRTFWIHNDPATMGGLKSLRDRRATMKAASLIICVSDYVRRQFLNGIADKDPRVIVLPNAIDMSIIRPSTKKKQICYLGRITHEKGVIELAQAFKKMAAELKSWKMIFVGLEPNDSGAVLTSYMKSIHRVLDGLGDRVAYTGRLPHAEAMAILAESEIAVVPSIVNEAFPRAAMEAMAYGAALITSDRGGLPEVTGSAALKIADVTPDLIAEALLKLTADDALRQSLRESAFERVKELDSKIQAARLDELRGLPP